MKTISRNISIALSALIMSGAAVGLQKSTSDDYVIVAFKDCEVVYEQPMNQTQIDAYLALKEDEDLMAVAEGPINDIQDDIDDLSDLIEDLTDRAIQDDGNTLYIDKTLLSEQQEVVEQLESLIDAHEADFDRIGEIGDKIAEKAEVFEQAIDESLEHVDYDQVNIRTPDSKNSRYSCYKGITML